MGAGKSSWGPLEEQSTLLTADPSLSPDPKYGSYEYMFSYAKGITSKL